MTNPDLPSDQSHHGRERRRVTLRFDELGWQSLESAARDDDTTLDELLALAIAYFEGERLADRAAAVVPRFKPEGHGDPREVRLALPPSLWRRVEDEAERQQVSLEQLIEHAALLYLADADAGRVADRVLREAEEADDA
jgi:hypothetical protein